MAKDRPHPKRTETHRDTKPPSAAILAVFALFMMPQDACLVARYISAIAACNVQRTSNKLNNHLTDSTYLTLASPSFGW